MNVHRITMIMTVNALEVMALAVWLYAPALTHEQLHVVSSAVKTVAKGSASKFKVQRLKNTTVECSVKGSEPNQAT